MLGKKNQKTHTLASDQLSLRVIFFSSMVWMMEADSVMPHVDGIRIGD